MTILLTTAVLAAAITTLHVWLGGRDIARPLLRATNLAPVAKYTSYYCWHLVTIVLYGMAAGFAVAAFVPESRALVAFLALMATAFSVWGFVLLKTQRRSLAQHPQGALFVPVALLSLWATFA
ncbi:MAG: hypothetical protein AAF436_15760 [Myxococcota bacterium]